MATSATTPASTRANAVPGSLLVTGKNPNEQTGQTDKEGREIKFLRPDELVDIPELDVRPFKDVNNEQEAGLIEALAQSIEDIGQRDDVIATPWKIDGKEVWGLLSGSRRRRAVALLNQKYASNAKPLLTLRVAIDRSNKDLVKKAWQSNDQRKSRTVLDLAMVVERLCETNKWEVNNKGFTKAADYLSVDRTTIHQAFKIYRSNDEELMRQVASGRISAQSAYDLLSEKDPKVRKAAILYAEEEEMGRRPDKAVEVKKAGKDGKVRIDVEMPRIENPSIRKGLLKAQGEAKPPVVETISVDFDDDVPDWVNGKVKPTNVSTMPTDKPKALRLKLPVILEFFSLKDGPDYGHKNGAIREFLYYFTQTYVTGKGSKKKADALFDAMVEKSDRGTEVKVKVEPKKVEPKPAPKKVAPVKKVQTKPAPKKLTKKTTKK